MNTNFLSFQILTNSVLQAKFPQSNYLRRFSSNPFQDFRYLTIEI